LANAVFVASLASGIVGGDKSRIINKRAPRRTAVAEIASKNGHPSKKSKANGAVKRAEMSSRTTGEA
jgi:hypothetical protein